jgi:NAD(P)-dependent dehydrogenase (short-subunit alcohol dehydrogenase family)
MTVRLDGKIALVTGATAGIGRGICVALAERGAHVIGMARSPEPGAAMEKELADSDGSFTFVGGDVNVRADCENAIDFTVAQHGRLDILINNAGHGFPLKRLENFEDDDWDTVMGVDLRSTFQMIRKALPTMQEQCDGVIINIASVVGTHAVERYGVYGAAKAAVSHLTRAIAIENLQYGIRANSIEMGAVATQHAADVLADMGRYVHGPDWTPTPPSEDTAGTPLSKALLDPGSVGRAVAVLCSDDAREINGAAIPMDGCFAAGFFASTLLHLGAAELLPG